MRHFLMYSLFLCCFEKVYSQVPGFTAPLQVCLGQTVDIVNTSTGMSTYQWDFCQDGLYNPKSIVQPVKTVASNIPVGIEIAYDKGNWYGFVCGRDNGSSNKLIRLSFGNSLSNAPAISPDYNATINGALSGVSEIKFINDNGNWFGFAANYYSNNIVRIDFGNSLGNDNPTFKNLGNPGGWNGLYGLDVIVDNGNYIIITTGSISNSISLIDYASSLVGSTPTVSSVKTVNSTTNALINSPVKIGVQKSGNSWYAIFSSLAGQVILLELGSNPMAGPTSISSAATISSPSALQFKRDGNNYFGFVQNSTGNLYRLDFGNTVHSSPAINSLGNFGGVGNVYGLSVVKEWPGWRAFFVGVFSNVISKLDFDDTCTNQSSMNVSNQSTPMDLKYNQSGTKTIELITYDALGNAFTTFRDIIIQNLNAPAVSFTNDGGCVSVAINFSGTESTGQAINSWSWDFGDGNTYVSNNPDAVHQYTTTGSNDVKLTVVAQNTCSSSITKTVSVYNPPIVNFELPIGSNCSNNSLLFNNTSTFDMGSSPSWAWFVEGIQVNTAEYLSHLFPSTGTYSVKLEATIPGCSNSISKNFLVENEGILVDFTFANQCERLPTIFTNTSVGSASDYSWNFGDSQTSTQANPNHTFTNSGNYTVQLIATNASGCIISNNKQVQIFSTPQPTFFTDLPPFSCAGTPTQLHDATPGLTDSNVVSWSWTFPDGTSANQKDPLHTFNQPGIYNVGLQATTNFGCSASVLLPVEIAASPSANFSMGAACLAKPTQFTNASSSNLQSMLWTIGNNSYSVANPVHTFNSAASYPVILTVKGANDCEASIVKNVVVKPIPVLDFSTSFACSNQETIFTDQTIGADLPASWLWNFGNSQTRTGSPANFAYDASGLFPVNLSVVTQAGCSYSTSKNILVSTSPEASFTESTSFGPPPLLVQFTNTSVNGSIAFWEFNDPQQNTSTGQNPLFTFSELGDYLVQLTTSNVAGCEDTFSKVIKVLIPVVDVSLEGLEVQANSTTHTYTPVITVKNNSNIFLGDVTVLVNGSSGTRLRTIVSLNIAPGNTAELVVPLELFSKENYLCVELEVPGDIDLSNNSACKNLRGQPILVKPYPNPSSGTISFEAILEVPGSGKLRIVDAMGHMIFNQTYTEMASGMNRVELDFSGKNLGLYLAIWELNGYKTEFRFIIN